MAARWPRSPRSFPDKEGHVLVALTGRTTGAEARLVPSPNPRRFNEIVVGVIGRALEVSPVELCGAVFMSNHYHLLVTVQEQQDVSRLMQHMGANLTKEVNRIRQRTGPMWARRYSCIVVSSEPEAQWDCLEYLLSNSVKEGLCESPFDWPGVHCAHSLVTGEPLEGVWYNRTKEWAARQRNLEFGEEDFATRYRVGFAPLPAYRHLPEEEYQAKVAGLIRQIEEKYAAKRAKDDDSVAGEQKILIQNPFKAPTQETDNSPKPLFHAKSPEAWKELMEDRRDFLVRYLAASDALRSGTSLPAEASLFPAGCYPPALPFTGNAAPPRPLPPPTRPLTFEGKKVVGRGVVPVVEVAVRVWAAEPQARGHPW